MKRTKDSPRTPARRMIQCEKRWLTTAELRDYVGFGSDDKQREWREQGLLPYYAVGNNILYDIKEVDAFIQRHKIVLPWQS